MEYWQNTADEQEQQGQTERCVLCGRTVPVRVDMPVEKRRYYVEGAGQLCAGCFDRLYAETGLFPL